ncbi:MAG: VCBS repeat-containing protein [Acidobacteria bacterium]|nr:VCBS repeat-containing protein [Acidobacteriota bacterium]
MINKGLILLALFFSFSIAAGAQQRFVADLSGRQEVPANGSTARGFCRLTMFQQPVLNCSFSNLSSALTNARVSLGGVGTNGTPVLIGIPFDGSPQSGNLNVTFVAIPSQFSELPANRIYINLSTANFPNGEIRGQFHLANGTYNDFDGDGRTDLTVYRTSNNSFYATSSLTGELFQKQIGQPGDSVSLTVDFDGDAISDFSIARYNADALWRIAKSTAGGNIEETHWGSSAFNDFFAAADYDGDGAFDIAVFRAGTWYILESSTGSVRYEYFGQSGDVPAANDFDKDGRADLTVARSEGGQRVWYVRQSSNGAFYSIPWGLSSDAFFTGRSDWDGDGAADIAVIRSESGQRVFYIRRSSDNQLQIIRWGLSSDVVKLGDYDGDGKTDAAVTRAENGQRVFYILQSATGTPRYETFGLQGDF